MGVDDRGVQQIAVLHDLVDETQLQRLLRADGRACGHHFDGLGHWHDARQALRAARAGQDAELHLRQAKLRFRRGDAVVAGERELQAAAEREAADRRDQRLLQRVLEIVDVGQVGLLARSSELADVGASREALSGADQHHRLDLRIGRRVLETLQDAGAQRVAEPVHRRVVHRDDGYAVADGVWRDFAHQRGISEGCPILTR